MNCKYCSVLFDTKKHGIPFSPQYSFSDLEAFITRTQEELHDDTADIYFFGGEPTVDFDCIDRLINKFDKEYSYKVNFIMHTNGLLIPSAPKKVLKRINLTLLSFNYELFLQIIISHLILGK